ncbi:MAG: glycosyl hydrolase 53 family protein [Oscillospiraceae bacterium]|nr:glycosyl hydrolase 53 family protein [Oscillospiraceae bacterium]
MKNNKSKKFVAVILSLALIMSIFVVPSGNSSVISAGAAVDIKEVVFPILTVNDGSPIRGVDISSIIAIENAGVVFRDDDGKPQDIFVTLREYGINYIRARVWNDPRDGNGNTYGGGNNDVHVAAEIGRRAAEQGMKLLVDFHYSDFWADPGKQTQPKAWTNFTLSKLETAIYDFTLESLKTIEAAGADIGMVQVGNETNYFMCGLRDMNNLAALMTAGSKAVRAFDKDILIAVHFTDPQSMPLEWYAGELDKYKVDYDVFMTSYYSFWHGTIANLSKVLSAISSKYGKYVVVAEMAQPYTDAAGDGFGHAVTSKTTTATLRYAVSPQGQVDMMRDIYTALAEIKPTNNKGGGIGAFYWEPAWLGVMGLTAQQRDALWNTHGSGWATHWAGEFDSEAKSYGTGGSSYQNQALFDFYGNPLDSLAFYRNVRAQNELPWDERPVTTPATTASTTVPTTSASTTTSRSLPTVTTTSRSTASIASTASTNSTASTTSAVSTTSASVTSPISTSSATPTTSVSTTSASTTESVTSASTLGTTSSESVSTSTSTSASTTTTTTTSVTTTTSLTTTSATTTTSTATTMSVTTTTSTATTTSASTTTSTATTTSASTTTSIEATTSEPATTTMTTASEPVTETTSETTTSAPDEPRLLGDADGNGVISINDALEVLKHLAKLTSTLDESPTNMLNAIIVSEGSPTINDALEILKYLAKLDSKAGTWTVDS